MRHFLTWIERGFAASICLLALMPAAGCTSPGSTASIPTATVTTSTPQETSSATPTIDWFPATATATRQPTTQYSATPELITGLGKELVRDTFSNASGWLTGKTAAGSVAFGQNELTLAVAASKGYLYSLRNDTQLDDYYLEIDAAPNLCKGADSYGLLLRADGATDYYRWVLTCDGQTRLERVKGGTSTPIQGWMLLAGPPSVHHLAVWLAGEELRFFVEGLYQFSVRDPSFTSGSLGVFARAAGDSALTVNFSNLTARAVSSAASPALGAGSVTQQPTSHIP